MLKFEKERGQKEKEIREERVKLSKKERKKGYLLNKFLNLIF